MSVPDESNVDAADIDVTEPPSSWAPALVDSWPNEVDVPDQDEDADD